MSNFSALLDACVIFPFSLSNILLESAYKGLYQVHFSNKILDEAIRNRMKKGRMNQVEADNFRAALIKGFSHALIEAPVNLEGKMENHSDDRHVLASAVYAKVDVIVTSNVKHFPTSSLAPWGMEVMHPDEFLNYLCDQNSDDTIYRLIREMIIDYNNPPKTDLDFFSSLETEQPKFSNRMLIFAYSDKVKNFARNALKSVTALPQGQRCLNGNRYQICEVDNGLEITERTTNRKVFRLCDDEMTGNIKVEDINIFEQVAKEQGVNKIFLPSSC